MSSSLLTPCHVVIVGSAHVSPQQAYDQVTGCRGTQEEFDALIESLWKQVTSPFLSYRAPIVCRGFDAERLAV